MNYIKQNAALVVGLAIPVIMILVIAGVVYLPRYFSPIAPAQYDFLYALGDNIISPVRPGGAIAAYPMKGVWQKNVYRVSNGKLIKQANTPQPKEFGLLPVSDDEPTFFIHHVATNTNTPLAFAEASALVLDTNTKSADGYDIVQGTGDRGIFPFFYGYSTDNYNKHYLHKDFIANELSLSLPNQYYQDFFIGWITK